MNCTVATHIWSSCPNDTYFQDLRYKLKFNHHPHTTGELKIPPSWVIKFKLWNITRGFHYKERVNWWSYYNFLPAKDSFLSALHTLPQHEPPGHFPGSRGLCFSCHIQMGEYYWLTWHNLHEDDHLSSGGSKYKESYQNFKYRCV